MYMFKKNKNIIFRDGKWAGAVLFCPKNFQFPSNIRSLSVSSFLFGQIPSQMKNDSVLNHLTIDRLYEIFIYFLAIISTFS